MSLFFAMLNPLEALAAPEPLYTYRHPLEVIRARGHALRLARITLDITTRWRSNETLEELVQPLLAAHFRGLTNVAVGGSYRGHRLPSSDLECMARVWPKIERLYLNWSVRDSMDPTTSTPPVGALAHCARHYPALRTLVRLARIDATAPGLGEGPCMRDNGTSPASRACVRAPDVSRRKMWALLT